MFVRARLEEGINPDALLVPQQGVTCTPRGDASVMVVGEGDKVEVRQSLLLRRSAINGWSLTV